MMSVSDKDRWASLGQYLSGLSDCLCGEKQAQWLKKLREQVTTGERLFQSGADGLKQPIEDMFRNTVRTEELKAWYGTREGDSLFQGTSVSALTIPYETHNPIDFKNAHVLEHEIADAYIQLHDRYESDVKNAIIEDTSQWRKEGLYYGVVIASKVISQAFKLSVPQQDVIFSVDGVEVDPHEITHYPMDIRERYFEICRQRITCLKQVDISRTEFESSLVLSDISKPRLSEYKDELLLAPVRCNEICTLISNHVTRLIKEKTGGRISPRSLMVTIYDTDTPYTWHQINGYLGNPMAPVLPGLMVLGSSGTIDAFRWLYAYRVSLIAQKMMKGSLCSEVSRTFTPFMFFGVLVERDADILLNMDDLGMLRYRGNISPLIEFSYLVPKLADQLGQCKRTALSEELEERLLSMLLT